MTLMKKLILVTLATFLCMQTVLCGTVYGVEAEPVPYTDTVSEDTLSPEDTESSMTDSMPESASPERTDSSIPDISEAVPSTESPEEDMPEESAVNDSPTEIPVPDGYILDESAQDGSVPCTLAADESVSDALTETESVAEQAAIGASTTSIKTATVTLPGSVSYTGKAVKPAPKITMLINKKTVTLRNKVDYKVSYKNNTNPGKATVTITGIGSYRGRLVRTFAIKVPMAKTKISCKSVIALSTGDKNIPVVSFQGKTLKAGTHYSLTRTEKQEGDSYTVVTYKITGKGNYTGTVKRTCTCIRNTDTIQSGKAYKLIPLLDVKTCVGTGSLIWENAAVYVRSNESSAESRKLIFKNCGNGEWSITNQCNDFVWTGKNADASASQTIVSKLGENKPAFRFTIKANADDSFSFLSAKSGCAVQVRNTKSPEGSDLFLNKRNAKDVSQKFYAVPVSATKHTYTGTYQVSSSVKGDYVWTVRDGKKANTTNICVGKNKNLPSQKFRLLYSGNGTYRIQCVLSYSMLDIRAAQYADFTNVQQYEWNGTDAQKWKVNKNGDGTYTFLSAGSNTYAIDLYAGNAVENGNVDIYKSNSTKAQKWILTKTSDIFPARPTSDELRYKVTGQEIVAYAKTWVGKISYTLGANGPLYVGGKSDCSWFIFRVLEHYGLMENWHKSLEYGRGTVPNTKLIYGGIANAKPGDILVWNEGPDTGHVTIYAGNNMAVGCNGITNVTGQVEYRWYTEPCGRNPDAICRLTNLA